MDLAIVGAVLLDMDGTLVSSDAAVERAWTVWAQEFGVDPASALAAAHGSPADHTVRRLLPALDAAAASASAARQLELQYDDLSDVTPAAGAHHLLATLDLLGLPWAVVTSADARLAAARLGAAGIVPPLLLTVDDVTAGKPDPQGYLLAAERLGVDPARCLVVEDAEPGVQAGRAAGAAVAALKGLDADLRIADLAQLTHLLSRARVAPWWRDSVGYQAYLPSFADSDGDGWGDLPGVAAHLDHLVELGVDVLWLTPFFTSPMRDHGYDVADYLRVDPRLGGRLAGGVGGRLAGEHVDGEQALDALLRAAHARGLRVLGDLVVNHTSDAHPWFAAAASSRTDPHRDYYIWRDPAPGGGPPNNWLSHFGGPAWTLDPGTEQYYLHLFRPEQPDLNWRHPAVADEVDAVLEHWLDRGLDGFRIDTAAYLIKHLDLPDNPLLPDQDLSPVRGVTADWRRQDHRYDIHQADVHTIHERWRRVADRYGAFLVGEVYEIEPQVLAGYVADERLHSSFWFGLVEADWDPDRIVTMTAAAAAASPRLSWVQGNHDRRRATSRYGGGALGRRRSLALHVLMALLPGMLWLYQGEELGLEDGVVPPGQGLDPLGVAEPGQSRDAARTPMPWRAGLGLGFTTGRPWLPDGGRDAADTAAAQLADPHSHLAAVRRLLAARRWAHTTATSSYGDLVHRETLPAVPGTDTDFCTGFDAETPAAYRRGGLWVLLNLHDTPSAEVDLPAAVVYDTDDPTVTPSRPRVGRLRLAPQQALLLTSPQQ